MKHGSLFTGIGGFDLAAERVGFENIFQVEKDKFCQKVLEKNFPNVKRYLDIKDFDGTEYRNRIDILSGGFPCQPFSQAGKRKGDKDERALFGEMFRIIREVQPLWILAENVGGVLSIHNGQYFEEICTSLEGEGYQVQPFIIPASAVNAPHRRDRIWIIANSSSYGLEGWKLWELSSQALERQTKILYSAEKFGGNVLPGTCFCRKDDGLPDLLDRLKSLGNSIVPQIAEIIFQAIKEIEDKTK